MTTASHEGIDPDSFIKLRKLADRTDEPIADILHRAIGQLRALFCGQIPGQPPGIGVIVTAFDLNSGQSVMESYPTPCS
jgi:hypothetical protein